MDVLPASSTDLPVVKMDVFLQLQVHPDVLQQVLQVNDVEALEEEEEEEEKEDGRDKQTQGQSKHEWFLGTGPGVVEGDSL